MKILRNAPFKTSGTGLGRCSLGKMRISISSYTLEAGLRGACLCPQHWAGKQEALGLWSVILTISASSSFGERLCLKKLSR